ncbi:unnamed protein product [Mycena citricolor]|uniref:Methyltransferase domain-containing protein n=1 Tax=Mycena citricolor TaxID=2018698 RepID=A0AAD2Q790_9AGAR|nr:unnamed protein product [Mycena citricolor]
MSSRRPATSPGPGGNPVPTKAASADGTPSSAMKPPLQKRHSTYTFTTPTLDHPSPAVAPPRPPRNPARSPVPASRQVKKPQRPSTATGGREEVRPLGNRYPRFGISFPFGQVTPWEFFPANIPLDGLPLNGSDNIVEVATGKREDVLPWELFPAPLYDVGAASKPIDNASHAPNNGTPNVHTPHYRQPRPSGSSGHGSILSDISRIRRRKSTGAKPPIATPVATPTTSHFASPPRVSTSDSSNGHLQRRRESHSPRLLHKTPSAATVRPPVSTSTVSGPESVSHSADIPSAEKTPTVDSHLDKPHLAEDLKFSTADRTILKELKRNISARAAQFVIKGGLDDRSGYQPGGASFMRMGAKHHAFDHDEVPYPRSYAREVLDLDVWETMACQRICNSLTWHVFEEPPTRILDIGCGTGTWVMNCGVAWKDSHFVGLDVVPLHPDLGASELATRITWVQANFLEGLPFPNDEFDFVHIKRIALGVPEDKWDSLFEEIVRILKPGGAFEFIEEDLFFPGKTCEDENASDNDDVRSDTVSEMRYAPPPSDGSDLEDDASVITGSGGSRVSYDGTPNTSVGAIPEEDEVPNRPYRHSYQVLSTAQAGQTYGPSGSANSLETDKKGKPRGYSTSTLPTSANYRHPSELLPPARPANVPFLHRPLAQAPPNPRDHSTLERIYNEMNASRFINLSPLSLLANLVGLYFKDVRTHPPLQFAFPPAAAVPAAESDSSDSDDARDAIVARPRRESLPAPAPWGEDRFVGTRDLLKRESRYISLDDSRMSALSPAAHSSFASRSPVARPALNRLPNSTLNIDVQSLNMHLGLRMAEVLACSESMWEWILSYQVGVRRDRAAGRPRTGSLASEIGGRRSSRLPLVVSDPETAAFKNDVLDLTREDFDALLVRFEMDMKEQMALGSVLRNEFGWPCQPLAPSQDRKVFITSCERWDQWQQRNQRRSRSPYQVDGWDVASSPPLPPEQRLSRSMRVFVAWKPL